MASTGSPTAIESESPNVTAGSPDFAILSTAMSDSGSVPTSLAGAVLASLNVIVAFPSMPSITWSLVIT